MRVIPERSVARYALFVWCRLCVVDGRSLLPTQTTIRNQFKVLYGSGFTKAKRKQFGPIILSNILDALATLCEHARPETGEWSPTQLAVVRKVSSGINFSQGFFFRQDFQLIKTFWEYPCVQKAYKRRGQKYSIHDCFDGYVQSLLKFYPAWGGEGWVPDAQDCVKARVRTSGIIEDELHIKGIRFRVFDVGGQRAERRKWFHCFDNVTCVLFVAALSGYNEVLYEDVTKNRLEEAFDLFDEITSVDFFADIPFLLFLNKRDIFERKYRDEKIDLDVSKRFPRAPARVEAPRASHAIEWISSEFRARFRKKREEELLAGASPGSAKPVSKKNLYVHVTDATDVKNVRFVFEDAKEIILTRNLGASGLM